MTLENAENILKTTEGHRRIQTWEEVAYNWLQH